MIDDLGVRGGDVGRPATVVDVHVLERDDDEVGQLRRGQGLDGGGSGWLVHTQPGEVVPRIRGASQATRSRQSLVGWALLVPYARPTDAIARDRTTHRSLNATLASRGVSVKRADTVAANAFVLPDQRLIECRPADTVLSAALRAGVPFAHACGGHSSCSTCRIIVVHGHGHCAERTPKESTIAERLAFPPEFRLACQTKITGDVTVRRLVLDDQDTELADIRPRFRQRARGPLRWAWGNVRGAQPRSIGDEVRAAIVFADIRGFTAFSEALLPYDVIHVLQRHVRGVAIAVERHGGVVTSFMGDGVMALFVPGRGESPGLRAVRAGLDMLARAAVRRPALEELYGRSFELNVGVHVGAVIVGTLTGREAATPTAIGDNVNVASRIEQANKQYGTQFLASEDALGEAGDSVVTGRAFTCQLTGKAEMFTLVEVLAIR